MLFLLLFLHDLNDVSLQTHFKTPIFCESSSGDWLLSDYFGSGILRVNVDGEITQNINYGVGQGPGEFRNPRYIFEFSKHKKIVVLGKHADTNVFGSSDGRWQEKILNFLPYFSAIKWDENHFLILWAKDVTAKKSKLGFFLYNLKGEEVDSWPVPMPFEKKRYLYESVKGSVIDENQAIYCGSMAKPEVFVYSSKSAEKKVWRIKPPSGYVLPPEKEFSKSDMFNKVKLEAYMNSFTYISNLYSVNGTHLVVAWRNAHEKGHSFDIYRFSDRQLVSSNTHVEGIIIGVTGNEVVTLLPEDESLEPDQDVSRFRRYPIEI